MLNTELHDMTLRVMNNVGLTPDPWQIVVISGDYKRLLLNCSRQAGKTSVVAVLGLVEAMLRPMTRILLLSRSLRQSREMFRLMVHYHQRMNKISLKRQTAEELEFTNDSRIVCMPCREDTIRGFAHIDILIIDEAARVPDDLYRAVRPMLAISGGRASLWGDAGVGRSGDLGGGGVKGRLAGPTKTMAEREFSIARR